MVTCFCFRDRMLMRLCDRSVINNYIAFSAAGKASRIIRDYLDA